MRPSGTILALAAAMATIAGCQLKGGAGTPAAVGAPADAAPTGIWIMQPTAMRVYPASRFTAEEGRVVLEARIELLDEMGDSIKGAGRFHLALRSRERQGVAQVDRQLYTWDVPLLSLSAQQRYYDKVTRTYLFRLKMDEQALPQRETVLEVTFTSAQGRTLHAEGVMASP